MAKPSCVSQDVRDAVAVLLGAHGLSLDDLARPPARVQKRYFTVAEAEQYSGLGRWTLARLHSAGNLPAIKLTPARSGKVLYDRADIDKCLRKHKKPNRMARESGTGKPWPYAPGSATRGCDS